MSSIGERLRQERLRRGLSIDQVAENTRISAKYLEAIESGEIDRIPGKFFARSFLRQYARAVELDERELSAELDNLAEAEPLPTAEELDQRPGRQRIDMEPITPESGSANSRRPWASLGVFVFMVLACSLIYVFWQRTQAPAPASEPAQNPPQQQASEPPQQQQPAAPAPAPATEPPAAQTETQPSGAPAQPQTAEGTPSTAPAQPQTATQGTPAAQQPSAAPGAAAPAETKPEAPAAPTGAVRLQVTSSEPAWVRVTVDGKVVMAGTLEPGVPKAFGGNEAIRIRSGNAGALEINYNGQNVGPIGPKGQIRTVEFTPNEFHPVTPPPKPAPDPSAVPPGAGTAPSPQ